jgi:hypothetical protein
VVSFACCRLNVVDLDLRSLIMGSLFSRIGPATSDVKHSRFIANLMFTVATVLASVRRKTPLSEVIAKTSQQKRCLLSATRAADFAVRDARCVHATVPSFNVVDPYVTALDAKSLAGVIACIECLERKPIGCLLFLPTVLVLGTSKVVVQNVPAQGSGGPHAVPCPSACRADARGAALTKSHLCFNMW